MKRFLTKKVLLSLAAVLALAGVVYSQTSIHEIEGILQFRATNPQIRVVGNASVRNRAGTGSGSLSFVVPVIVTTGAASTRTLLPSECGGVVVDNATSLTQTYTLPAVTNAGCQFTFIAGHASGEILINASTTLTCVVTTFATVGVDADTGIVTDASCQTGLKNTAGTNAIGDSLVLVSDGTRWLGVGVGSGIWTTQ